MFYMVVTISPTFFEVLFSVHVLLDDRSVLFGGLNSRGFPLCKHHGTMDVGVDLQMLI